MLFVIKYKEDSSKNLVENRSSKTE